MNELYLRECKAIAFLEFNLVALHMLTDKYNSDKDESSSNKPLRASQKYLQVGIAWHISDFGCEIVWDEDNIPTLSEATASKTQKKQFSI